MDTRLLERQRTLSSEEVAFYVAEWRRLKAENAPLRIVEKEQLVSAPITYFDDEIISRASNDWKKAAFVIGETMAMRIDKHVSDLLLWARVHALVEAGVLELRGDISHIHSTEVRLNPLASRVG